MAGFNISINEKLAKDMCSQEIATYFTLKRFMNHKTKQCFPSIKTLASLLDWAENTVRKWLRSLQSKGFIKIERRYEIKNGRKQNFSNLYTFLFEGVLQKNKKTTSKVEGEHIQREQNNEIDAKQIKKDLTNKYGKDIVDKAIMKMKISIDKGTNIYNLKGYLEVVCSRLRTQTEITKGISQVGSVKADSGQKKNHPCRLTGGWGSSSISRASTKYTNDDLEKVFARKRKEYFDSK